MSQTPHVETDTPLTDGATAAAIATWPGDRPSILRILQCRLLHRGEWEYLGTRHEEDLGPWPLDGYRCEHCERTWERVA